MAIDFSKINLEVIDINRYCKINCAKRKRHRRRHSLQTLVE